MYEHVMVIVNAWEFSAGRARSSPSIIEGQLTRRELVSSSGKVSLVSEL